MNSAGQLGIDLFPYCTFFIVFPLLLLSEISYSKDTVQIDFIVVPRSVFTPLISRLYMKIIAIRFYAVWTSFSASSCIRILSAVDVL